MNQHYAAGAVLLCMMLSGCSSSGLRIQMAADVLASADAAERHGTTKLDHVHFLVQDSQEKCGRFVTSLFSRAASTSTALDIGTTVFSALATVFTPISTVHALTAGATIASGTKTSIQTEFLNSVTISHIVQAIHATYDKDMQKYIAYLNSVTEVDDISVLAERSTILSYHNECALPAAEGSIGSALQPTVPKEVPQLSLTFRVANDGDSKESIASAIAAAINAEPSFKAAGVKASERANPGDGTILIGAPTGVTVTWQHTQFTPANGKGSATEQATFDDGPPVTLTIGGRGQKDDALMIASKAPGAPVGTSAPVPLLVVRPAAGVSGMAPQDKR